MKKYTLDRIDDGICVFLEYPDEVNQLLISCDDINVDLSEGDIVNISKRDSGYIIEVLKEETKITADKVSALLEKLKNKK